MNSHIIIIITLIQIIQTDLPFLDKLAPYKILQALEAIKTTSKQIDCNQFTVQLTNLFTLMCNNIANGADDVLRDSCIGCFQRASTINNNQPSSSELISCAQNYLTDTRYELCLLQIDTITINSTTGCVEGYCRFVRCIRRINSDLLLSQCYADATLDNDAESEEEQVMLIKDVISCILARTRCSSISPITGLPQINILTTTTYDKWHKATINRVRLYNSLQITSDGDLRIVSLPETLKIQNYFCIPQPNLRQSSWLSYNC